MYAFPAEAHRGCIDRKKPALSGDTELSGLINEEFSDAMTLLQQSKSYGRNDQGDGVLEFIAILEERDHSRKWLELIFATGITQ